MVSIRGRILTGTVMSTKMHRTFSRHTDARTQEENWAWAWNMAGPIADRMQAP